MSARDQAKELLVHYLYHPMPDGYYSADSVSEMESIVDRIVDAAVEETKAEIRRLLPGPAADKDGTTYERALAGEGE